MELKLVAANKGIIFVQGCLDSMPVIISDIVLH